MIGRANTFRDLDRPFRALISLVRTPRAMPWAAIGHAVGVEYHAPKVPTIAAKGNALDCCSRCLYEARTTQEPKRAVAGIPRQAPVEELRRRGEAVARVPGGHPRHQVRKNRIIMQSSSAELSRPVGVWVCLLGKPRALPWAAICRAVGAKEGGGVARALLWAAIRRAVGAEEGRCAARALLVATIDSTCIASDSSVPKGHPIVAQGSALGLIHPGFQSPERAA